MKNVVSRVALVALMAASMAACAKKPEPKPIEQPQQPAVEAPQPQPQPPVQQQPTGPIPGSEQDFVINAGDRVYFDFDQYSVRDEARGVLDAQAAWLARYPGVTVRIEGNADERGTREYNMALGARRANAVRDYLVSRGVSASRIETISYGKERPIDPGSNEDAWARNRNAHTAITAGAR
ncbi:peptidoglycan-associated lipoprotein Pal [Caulobacter sp. 17J80-11]|uniref:peptidoglycan-associated lipoprotein Pal n=1 Tax=Caulobacter sp. 17J80-11 TaxID=2763502 RepID=UPI001653B9F8|nr:peptidoglycan-associated lipoprotein Pal [Caulobacter sp. 17J80-11]MBC6980302.1 peptidoglycan-associated lipoprotein Pal [Caulobacter sp. 17J80-11]